MFETIIFEEPTTKEEEGDAISPALPVHCVLNSTCGRGLVQGLTCRKHNYLNGKVVSQNLPCSDCIPKFRVYIAGNRPGPVCICICICRPEFRCSPAIQPSRWGVTRSKHFIQLKNLLKTCSRTSIQLTAPCIHPSIWQARSDISRLQAVISISRLQVVISISRIQVGGFRVTCTKSRTALTLTHAIILSSLPIRHVSDSTHMHSLDQYPGCTISYGPM